MRRRKSIRLFTIRLRRFWFQVELKDAMNTEKYEKLDSYSRAFDAAKKKAIEALPEEQKVEGKKLFDSLKERIFRDEMLKAKRRPDGRKFDQVRKIECRSGRAAADSRVFTVYARRDAGAGYGDARDERRRAAD